MAGVLFKGVSGVPKKPNVAEDGRRVIVLEATPVQESPNSGMGRKAINQAHVIEIETQRMVRRREASETKRRPTIQESLYWFSGASVNQK
jgi:hypothetical protein